MLPAQGRSLSQPAGGQVRDGLGPVLHDAADLLRLITDRTGEVAHQSGPTEGHRPGLMSIAHCRDAKYRVTGWVGSPRAGSGRRGVNTYS